jgi:serine/threonine-protein kinase
MPVEDHAAWNVGRYTVHGELASGGMATVHIGRMGAIGGFTKLVAIKRMHPQFAKDPDFLAMFLDEARLVTRIRHPNVVQPLDVIVEGTEVLLVMEYIHGDALSRISRVLRGKNERIPLRIAIAIMSGVLHGLHAAHEAKSEKGEPLGIVHRDVSPQNVIVGVDGVSRVLDFGIAKAADQVHLTREGELKGKLVYMAPEQLLGEVLTRRTDIFSASVVLWECLTGHRLFDSDSQSALLARARMQKVDPPSEFAPEIPKVLDDIVGKGLALQQSARWTTARDMAFALEEAVQPATTAQVGAWVEQVAAKVLAERQSRIDEIESAGADSSAHVRELVADIASDRVFTQDILSARSKSASHPRITPPPPAARSGNHPASRHTPTPTPPPPPAAISGPTMRSRAASQTDERADINRLSAPPMAPLPAPPPRSALAPNAPSVHNPYYVPPANDGPVPPMPPLGTPSLEAPAIPTELAKPAKTHTVKLRNSGRYGTIFVLLFISVFLIGLLGSPSFVRSRFVDALAKRGIVATIDEVDLYSQVGTARVVGLTMTSPDVPGATVHAHEVLVDLDGNFEPKSIIARDVDVNVDVGYAPLLRSLGAWSRKHGEGSTFGFPQSMHHARIESAHIVWNQPSGAGTRLEARSLTLDMIPKENRALGDDFVMEPTSIDLSTPLGSMGPWLVDASRAADTYAVHLSFNQAHQQSFGMDLTGSDAAAKLDLRISRAIPPDIGAKSEMFGATMADIVKIDATVHAERKADAWTATASFGVDGLHAPGAKPAPFAVDFALAGVRAAPMDIQHGRLSFGAGDSALTGTVAIGDDAIVAKVASMASLRCDDGGVAHPAMTFTLDTRDIGAATLAPARLCAAHTK